MEVFQVLNHLFTKVRGGGTSCLASGPQAMFTSVPPRTGKGETEIKRGLMTTPQPQHFPMLSVAEPITQNYRMGKAHGKVSSGPFLKGGENQIQGV